MSSLTIQSDPSLGPLDVSIYPPSGDPIDFTLSSGQLQASVPAEAGRYAIVARRPNGARIIQNTVVGEKDETVFIKPEVGPSPNEFMTAETFRGQIRQDPALDPSLPWRAALAGSAGAALRSAVLTASSFAKSEFVGVPAVTDITGSVAAAFASGLEAFRAAKRSETLDLRLWRLDASGSWNADTASKPVEFVKKAMVSGDFLKLEIETHGGLLCLGLLDGQGFGPILNIPPFAEPIEVTFLSKGVLVQAADRMATPSGQRVPVALSTPANHAAADLLATLAAPAIPGATALWDQNVGVLDPNDSRMALDMFARKFERPAEALLAAHYLLRFLPKRLPLDWTDNLSRVSPAVADGPAIAAWARVLNRPKSGKSDEEVDKAIEENITVALSRPVTLFARTRALLADARHLVSKKSAGAEAWRQESEYRRFGAEAGGLESFWGGGPVLPGKSDGAASGPVILRVRLINGGFASSGETQPVPLEAS